MEKKFLITIIIAVVALVMAFKSQYDVKVMECDMNTSVFAERAFTYPILRTIQDPSEVAKEVKNPVAGNLRYTQGCGNPILSVFGINR